MVKKVLPIVIIAVAAGAIFLLTRPSARFYPQPVTTSLTEEYTLDLWNFKPNEMVTQEIVEPNNFQLVTFVVDSEGKHSMNFSGASMLVFKGLLGDPQHIIIQFIGDMGSQAQVTISYS